MTGIEQDKAPTVIAGAFILVALVMFIVGAAILLPRLAAEREEVRLDTYIATRVSGAR